MSASSKGQKRRGRPKKTTTMTNITMTEDQFARLLSQLQTDRPSPSVSPVIIEDLERKGNFVRCTSRFSGLKDSDVESFICAVEIFMDCANVSENNALKGLPMLLTDVAATWWIGVKDSTNTWKEAITALRAAFGKKLEPYQIYKELFSMNQDDSTPTDLFLSQTRALLSGIPENLTEKMKLDMIYGLLNRRIRKRVPRESFHTFDKLLSLSRTAEQTLKEKDCMKHIKDEKKPLQEHNEESRNKNKQTEKIRCRYCKIPGHKLEECKTLKRKKEIVNPPEERTSVVKPNSVPFEAPGIACYGCGTPGVIRAKCPKCKPKERIGLVQFHTASIGDRYLPRNRPLLPVKIFGFNGVATADTGASRCIMGRNLYELVRSHCEFESKIITLTLADGITEDTSVSVTKIPIKVGNRSITTEMIVLPGEADNSTLLGTDVLSTLGIVLDIGEGIWYFRDSPNDAYTFSQNSGMDYEGKSIDSIDLYVSETLHLRTDEGTNLTVDQRAMINGLIEEHQEVFVPGGDPTPYAEHCIITSPDQHPISVPPYRLSVPKKEQLRNELDKMLKEKIIEECDSPWAAPVVLVPKPNGSVRVCIDYRGLNAVTISDSYPLPRIDDLLHEAKQSRYMTTIDLRSGYWQIRVRDADKDKTAFISPFGTYRFLRMPFGLKNAPASFQRLIDKFKSGLSEVHMLAYLDDLIILSDTFEGHVRDLDAVFQRLELFGLRANRSKCNFGKSEVRYLGHILTAKGIQADPEKISALKNRPVPKNLKELISILQTSAWYRRFIENYAEVVRPLTGLTKKKATWKWGEEQQVAYTKLMELLTTAPILRQADTNLPYTLRTDASSFALGAVLLQGEGPDERPVEYASRLLLPAEQNYSTTEREALAVVWALQKFRGYVECSRVTIATDHQPLKWLMSLKTPTGRLARWALQLQNFNLDITYIPGKTNVIADTLSRPPRIPEVELQQVVADLPHDSAEEIRTKQLLDPDLRKVIEDFETVEPNDKFAQWTDRGYVMSNGVLYHYDTKEDNEEAQLVIPINERHKVLEEFHDAPTAGHNGVERTTQRIRRKYYWPGLKRYVADYVGKCLKCQRYKPTNLKPAGLLQTPAYARRMEVVSLDFFGPLPITERRNAWILVVEDVSTRWVELFAMPSATAFETAKLLIEEVFLRYGLPRRLVSDNGVQFTSAVLQQITHILGIDQVLTSIYHPESNPTERKNRDLKPQLALLVGNQHSHWDLHLPAIRFSLNSAVCQNTGYSAAYLTFGRELRTVFDVRRDLRPILDEDNFVPLITPYLHQLNETLQEAREIFEREQDRQKRYADQHRRPAPTYSPGDRILLKVHNPSNASQGITHKLMPKRDGPYIVLRSLGPVTYELASPTDPTKPLCKVHVSELTPYVGQNTSTTDDPIPIVEKKRRGRPKCQPVPVKKRGRGRPKRHPNPVLLVQARGRQPEPEGECNERTLSPATPPDGRNQKDDEKIRWSCNRGCDV